MSTDLIQYVITEIKKQEPGEIVCVIVVFEI